MKRKTIEITDCNDCNFVGIDDNDDEYCTLDDGQIQKRFTPLKVGKYTLRQKDDCFLKNHIITFKLKP